MGWRKYNLTDSNLIVFFQRVHLDRMIWAVQNCGRRYRVLYCLFVFWEYIESMRKQE